MTCNIFYISNKHLNLKWKKSKRSPIETKAVAGKDFRQEASTLYFASFSEQKPHEVKIGPGWG